MADRMEVLQGYVADMVALERHLVQTIERQTSDDDIKKYPEAQAYLNKVSSVLEKHIAALEGYVGDDDGESTLKKAVGTAAGFVTDIVDKFRTDTVSKMLRDDYAILALGAISYEMLLTTALCLNNNALADLCEHHIQELALLVHEANMVVCTVVGKELTDEGKVPNAHGVEEAMRRIHEMRGVAV